jgi:hypothetical protein
MILGVCPTLSNEPNLNEYGLRTKEVIENKKFQHELKIEAAREADLAFARSTHRSIVG